MKILLFVPATLLLFISLGSCRRSEKQKAYEYSLLNVMSCTGEATYTNEQKLEAGDLFLKERPDQKQHVKAVKACIKKEMEYEEESSPFEENP